jgi:hypothetical protein
MKLWLAAFVGLMMVAGSVQANELATADDLALAQGGEVALDTSENFGIGDFDRLSRQRFLCFAAPLRGHLGLFRGDDRDLYRAKYEALRNCHSRTNSRCVIRFCRRVSGHHH